VSDNVSLKQIERKAWTSFFQDGLLDILMGLLLLLMAVPDMLSDVFPSQLWQRGTNVALAGLAFVIFWAGKRFITMPRLGRVRFDRARKVKKMRLAPILTAASILTGILMASILLAQRNGGSVLEAVAGSRAQAALGLAVWIILILSLASYFMEDFTRGYVIGVLCALGFSGTILLDNPFMFAIAGAVILLMGLVVFIRFLRKYPIPAQELAPNN
jgi:hypothetical protein